MNLFHGLGKGPKPSRSLNSARRTPAAQKWCASFGCRRVCARFTAFSCPRCIKRHLRILKLEAGLEIDVIGVLGAEQGRGERLFDVIAREKMAVTGFQLREARGGKSGDDVQFR